MPQESRGAFDAQTPLQPVHLTAMAQRSAGQLSDLNVSAARLLLQTQARAASAFGLPDWSPLFDSADERVRHAFSAGAEQVLDTAQRTNEVVSELHRQVGRVIETQASQAAQSWQRGLEELGSHTSESLNQLCETARKTAEDAQQMGEQFRDNVRRVGDEARPQQQTQAQSGEQRRPKPAAA